MPRGRILLLLVFGALLSACSLSTPALPPTQLAQPTPTLPTPSPQPTRRPLPTATPSDDQQALVSSQQTALNRDQIMLAQAWGIITDTPPLTLRPVPAVGEQRVFWATDVLRNEPFLVTATLQVRTPHLALFVADDLNLDPVALQQAATTFEQESWPVLERWYAPFVPQQPVSVLNAYIPGVGGYYASDNELPQVLNRYSNEQEIIYINVDGVNISTPAYRGTLTHEMQHLLHRNANAHSATWFNEGASMFSEDQTGTGSNNLVNLFLQEPDTQLNAWAETPGEAHIHYGAAELWLRYLNDQADGLPLGQLAQLDAGDNLLAQVAAVRERFPDITTFSQLFATWCVANVINDTSLADGRYGYASLPSPVTPSPALFSDDQATVHQLAADYLALPAVDHERTIRWTGALTVPVIHAPTSAEQTLWWSGRGDSRVSTLTAAVTVPSTGAQLSFAAWYDIETNYDYAYLTVSTDGGHTWQSLPTSFSTASNPLGLNLGAGWTGQQPVWQAEQIDLSPWSGQSIQLRFWMITDDAYNGSGLALRDLTLSSAAEISWQAAGWQQIRNQLPQQWELRGILLPDGQAPTVVPLTVVDGQVEWSLPANTRAILMVAATTAATTELAHYQYVQSP